MPKHSLTRAPRWIAALAIVLLAGTTELHAQQAASDKLDVDPAVLDDLVAANRILAHRGVLDAFGLSASATRRIRTIT